MQDKEVVGRLGIMNESEDLRVLAGGNCIPSNSCHAGM